MSCPNCKEIMQTVILDNQIILHCSLCGASFFEENGINRISFESAEKLFEEKKNTEVSGQEKLCPKDKTILKPIVNQENIPTEVTLLRCSTCKGIFVFADDLINFKKAQEAKIDYFKAWNIPLPSLKAVVVLSFVALVSAAIFSRFILFQRGPYRYTNATDLIKNIYLSKSGRYLFISFKTDYPFRSKIIFNDKTANITISKNISQKLTFIHFLTTTDIDFNHQYNYQIILIDNKGQEITTEEKELDAR